MGTLTLLEKTRILPRPHDANAVTVGLQRWAEGAERLQDPAAREAVEGLARDSGGGALLAALFGNSPYLTRLALGEQHWVWRIVNQPLEQTGAEAMVELWNGADGVADKAELMRVLRVAKRRIALLTAIADITGQWSLERVTATLSDLADAALQASVRFLLSQAAARGDIGLPDLEQPTEGSGFAVFALGKQGGRELNYSSDIDIMVLFDQDAIDYRGPKEPTKFYSQLTQTLVEIMRARTEDGYVFRTDLRLRPDPGVSPLALSMVAAEGYYETLGQNWERAAMIKARCVAGDIDAGNRFLARLTPFIWRKYLDFAAIEDIHSIKRQIHRHRGHDKIALAGHNIKIGRGGIREIEFFAQTQQLIAGGRDPRLRQRTTSGALGALAETGRLDQAVADELIGCYRFLRGLEHRLQMIGDEQTHTLPREPDGLERLAAFMGFADAADLGERLLAVLGAVERHYDALFERAPELSDRGGSLVFTGTEDDPATLETLRELGFREPERVAAAVRRWHHGRYRATRSARAREKLTGLMPALIRSLAGTANPDMTLVRFDGFLAQLPAGIQLFSLIQANPWLLDLLARIMGTAPNLAETLSHNTSLLDAVLSADFHAPLAGADALLAELRAALAEVANFEDVLDIARRWANDRRFQVGLQVLERPAEAARAGPPLSDVADTVLRALAPAVEAEFTKTHGRVPGSAWAMVALGRLGGREMTFGSDLDLIFVYDHPAEVSNSDGQKPLPPVQYFARLSQRMIAALTALTSEGRLYEVDMRLRPSGKSGPIAVTLQRFADYQRESAWTWEHMALTRARVVAGPDRLTQAIEATIADVLWAARDQGQLLADVADMRARIDREFRTDDPWHIKHVRGGLVDIDFIAQSLQLAHAQRLPAMLSRNTAIAFERLGQAGVLASAAADRLADAAGLLGNVHFLLRLCTAGGLTEETASPDLKIALAGAVGTPDFATAERALRDTEAWVHAQFEQLIGKPAANHRRDGAPAGGRSCSRN